MTIFRTTPADICAAQNIRAAEIAAVKREAQETLHDLMRTLSFDDAVNALLAHAEANPYLTAREIDVAGNKFCRLAHRRG